MKSSWLISSTVTIAVWLTGPHILHAEADQAAKLEFFEKKIRPILVNHCYTCHSAETKPAGGLRVDDRNGILNGGDEGPAAIIGDADASLILKRILHENPRLRMPQDSDPLTAEQIADLKLWVEQGLTWPAQHIPSSLTRENPEYKELKENHWAWQPLKNPALPKVKNTSWVKEPLDQFVLARLESSKLQPVEDADPVTLIRRVTFDLTGLPPSKDDVEKFIQNPSEQAYAALIDRLIASPAFAERWGRHWLDVARYGESTGPSRNIPYPHAWKYRDYVIDSVNNDVPFNRFIQEQIAGDLLPADSSEERDKLLTATGFLAIGVKDVNQRFKERFVMDNVDEKIDVVTRSVLGLTVSCARCHDHKTDPIPTAEYYALAGIFTSTDDCAGVRNKMGGGGLDYYVPEMLVKLATDTMPAPSEEEVNKRRADVDKAKEAWDAIRGTPEGREKLANGQLKQRAFRVRYDRAQAALMELTDPAARGYAVHGVRESAAIADTAIRIRGEAERLGPVVSRGFLNLFESGDDVPKEIPADQSGRLELAKWLTSESNPLTPRVLANRVWHHLFGRGIVSTVDNFGLSGDVPSNPELLDHLANRLIQNDWSLKKLVREVVLSRSYQLASTATPQHVEIDPGNILVWRHSPRRLSAEEMRDSMLVASERLESRKNGSPASSKLRMIEMRDNGAEAGGLHKEADTTLVRSVYLPQVRGIIPKSLEAFDPVSQTLVSGQRETTTVPTQALFLLNASFVRQQSLVLAEQTLGVTGRSAEDHAKHIYQRVLNRAPHEDEVTAAVEFIESYEQEFSIHEPVLLASLNTGADQPGNTDDSVEPPVSTSSSTAGTNTASTSAAAVVPANPDDVDRTEAAVVEEEVQPPTSTAAAWMSFVQALYASAEFRFVR